VACCQFGEYSFTSQILDTPIIPGSLTRPPARGISQSVRNSLTVQSTDYGSLDGKFIQLFCDKRRRNTTVEKRRMRNLRKKRKRNEASSKKRFKKIIAETEKLKDELKQEQNKRSHNEHRIRVLKCVAKTFWERWHGN